MHNRFLACDIIGGRLSLTQACQCYERRRKEPFCACVSCMGTLENFSLFPYKMDNCNAFYMKLRGLHILWHLLWNILKQNFCVNIGLITLMIRNSKLIGFLLKFI